MKFFDWKSMYFSAILFLLIQDAFASYFVEKAWPINLSISILTATVIDLLVKKFYLKKKLMFPSSAFITGTIVGSIAPFSSSPVVVIVASTIGILSKFFIRTKKGHVFNPATLGLIISLFIFGLGDEWWAATGHVFSTISFLSGIVVNLTPLLVFPNYRARKLYIAIPFLLTLAISSYATGYLKPSSFSTDGILNYFFSFPYFFAFIMVSEPKTTPYKKKEQIGFGIGTALLLTIFTFYSIRFYLFLPLLIANFVYFLYSYLKISKSL